MTLYCALCVIDPEVTSETPAEMMVNGTTCCRAHALQLSSSSLGEAWWAIYEQRKFERERSGR